MNEAQELSPVGRVVAEQAAHRRSDHGTSWLLDSRTIMQKCCASIDHSDPPGLQSLVYGVRYLARQPLL